MIGKISAIAIFFIIVGIRLGEVLGCVVDICSLSRSVDYIATERDGGD